MDCGMSASPSSPPVQRDEAARLLGRARDRSAAILADLFVPPSLRLTDWQRTSVAALLEKLVRAVEDDLRARLAERFPADSNDALNAALVSPHVEIALPVLIRFRALRDPELVAAAWRRTEEHRLHRLRTAPGPEVDLLAELVGDSDEGVAAEAMALLVAQSRRFDRFDEPVMARTELSAEIEHRLVWSVAAALRSYLIRHHSIAPAIADEALAEAADAMIAEHDEGDSLEARAFRLAVRLRESGRLDDILLGRTRREAGLPLLVAGLAARASQSYAAAWEIVSDPDGRGAALLLRAGGVAREASAAILFDLQPLWHSDGESEPLGAQLDLYDSLASSAAREALRLWRADPAYRRAIAAMAGEAE